MIRATGLMVLGVVGLACSPAPVPFSAPRGEALGAPTEVKIGPSGGTLSYGALTVSFPAGALAAETTISATPISPNAPGHRGQTVRLAPDGTTFAQPVTLTFGYSTDDLVGTSPEALLVAFQHSSGMWAVPGDVTVDTTARTVSVKTTHFSDWSMVAGAQLRPPSASVKTGERLTLTARRCFAQPESSAKVDPELAPLVIGYPCDADEELAPLPVVTSEWSVNGAQGGSGTTGTVSGSLGVGTFVAPGEKPTPAAVAVSARVDLASKGKVMVVSNVTITDGAKVILVRGRYQRSAQLLTAFVTGDVTDEGVEFELPFPMVDGDLVMKNITGGSVTAVTDTRPGCITPTLGGTWDELNASKVTLTGRDFVVEGTHVVPTITLGVGEGDCATMTRTEAAATTTKGEQVLLPSQLSSGPPATPLVVTSGYWTWTYTAKP